MPIERSKGEITAMGKLTDYLSMKRDLAFDYERELRAVRDLMHGVTRLSGSDFTIDLTTHRRLRRRRRCARRVCRYAAGRTHDALLHYAHDLAREGLEHGMDQDVVSNALSGARPLQCRVRTSRPQLKAPRRSVSPPALEAFVRAVPRVVWRPASAILHPRRRG